MRTHSVIMSSFSQHSTCIIEPVKPSTDRWQINEDAVDNQRHHTAPPGRKSTKKGKRKDRLGTKKGKRKDRCPYHLYRAAQPVPTTMSVIQPHHLSDPSILLQGWDKDYRALSKFTSACSEQAWDRAGMYVFEGGGGRSICMYVSAQVNETTCSSQVSRVQLQHHQCRAFLVHLTYLYDNFLFPPFCFVWCLVDF